jgi:hypothetical protein
MNKKEILNIIEEHPEVDEGEAELWYKGFENEDTQIKSKEDVWDEIEHIIELGAE